MKILGFNFTKMNIEKISDNLDNLKITTGIDISDMNEVKSDLFKSKEELIGVKFKYSINYEKDIARIDFEGNLVLLTDEKEAKEVLAQWKEKKIPEAFKLNLFNIILKKSSLKALQFEEEFNLPPHIPLPSFKPAEKKNNLL